MEPILLKPPHTAGEPISLAPSEPGDRAQCELALGDGVAIDRQAVTPAAPAGAETPGSHSAAGGIDPIPLLGYEAATAPQETPASAPSQIVLGPARGPIGQVAELVRWLASRVFGAISLIVALSFLAAYPVLHIFSLGYLLEAAGGIGRSGRLRDAFPLVREASRIGGMLLGGWLVLLPWRFAGDLVEDAVLIDPASSQTLWLTRLVALLTVLTPLHILFAVMRGGRLRYFFWPFNVLWFVRRVWRGGYFREAWNAVSATWREFQVLHYFYLGLRGGLGALLWLAIPATLYAVGSSAESPPPAAVSVVEALEPAAPVESAELAESAAANEPVADKQPDGESPVTVLRVLAGGILLSLVVLYLPFLQVHFAAENRFRAMFEVSQVRERFRKAPIAFLIAFVFTLLLVLPLYLLKIEVVPRDALWLPSLLFIVTIFPLKVMTGWAYGRAGRKTRRAHWVFRVGCRLLMLPVAAFYSLIVFFTQYTGWHGVRALFEQHAFLLLGLPS